MLRLWDARRRTTADTTSRGARDLSFSPDGRTLAVTLRDENFNGGLEILSVPDLELVRTVRAPIGLTARFSRDGRSLSYGDLRGRVWTYDTRDWTVIGRPLVTRVYPRAVEHSADGRLLATTSFDGTGQLWDVASHRPIGAPLPGAAEGVVGAAFLGASTELAVAHERGGYAWDVRPSAWTRHACAVAGRTAHPRRVGERPARPRLCAGVLAQRTSR